MIPFFFPGPSLLRKIDFRLRQLALLAYVLLLMETDPVYYALFSLYALSLLFIYRINPLPLLQGFFGFFLIFFLLAMTQLWSSGDAVEQFLLTLLVFWRYLLYFSLGFLLFQSTTVGEISQAMAWFLRPLGRKTAIALSTMSSLAIGFVPWIFELTGKTALALRLRGLTGIRTFFPFIYYLSRNLLFSVFSKVSNLAHMLKLRGLEERKTVTPYPMKEGSLVHGLGIAGTIMALAAAKIFLIPYLTLILSGE
jgi:hypothetical protein